MGKFDFGWPWIGLGGAIVVLILMFCTNVMRSGGNDSRWRDPVWLAWLVVPMYLLHQFEEYAIHCDFVNGTYAIIENVVKMQGNNIPLAHFPLVNIALVWFGAPLAALLCKRNPIIGLSYYGFVIANGLLHASSLVSGNFLSSPGFFTGTLLFIPTTIWMIHVCLKSNLMPKKGIVISLLGGIIGHAGLFGAYAIVKVGGDMAMFVLDVFAAFLPILFTWFMCKIMGLSHIAKADAPN